MAENKKYYHNLDVENNKVMNLLLNPLTTVQRTAIGAGLGLVDQSYVCYDTDLNQQYFWDGTQWIVVGGSSAIWGGITGTVTNQTDLITYLGQTYVPYIGAINHVQLGNLSYKADDGVYNSYHSSQAFVVQDTAGTAGGILSAIFLKMFDASYEGLLFNNEIRFYKNGIGQQSIYPSATFSSQASTLPSTTGYLANKVNGISALADGSITIPTGGGTNPTDTYIPYNNAGTFADSYLINDTVLGILKTNYSGTDKGIYLDFVNNEYYLGDTNYFIKVNTSVPNTTISTLSGTGTQMVVADASGILSRQDIPLGTVTGSGTLNYVSKWDATGTNLVDSQILDDGVYVRIGNGGGSMGFPYETLILEKNGDVKFGVYTSVNTFGAGGSSIVLGATGTLDENNFFPGFEFQFSPAYIADDNFIRYNFIERNALGNVTASNQNIFNIYADGRASFQALVNGGTSMVVADSAGFISTQPIPSGGGGTVTNIDTSAPLTGGPINVSGTIGITQSNSSTDGYLSSADWNYFDSKQDPITLTTTGTSGAATFIGGTLNIPQYQSVLTNPVTGTGVATRVAFWDTTSSISSDSGLYWDNTNKRLGIGNSSPNYTLDVTGTGRFTNTLYADTDILINNYVTINTTATTIPYNMGIWRRKGNGFGTFFMEDEQGGSKDKWSFVQRTGYGGTRAWYNTNSSIVNINYGWGNSNTSNFYGATLLIDPTINITDVLTTGLTIRGIYYNPTLTSLVNTTHIAYENTTGNVLLGTTSGSVGIGTSTPAYKLDVNGNINTNAIYYATHTNNVSVTGIDLTNSSTPSLSWFKMSATSGQALLEMKPNNTAFSASSFSILSSYDTTLETKQYSSMLLKGAYGLRFYGGTNISSGQYLDYYNFYATTANTKILRVSHNSNFLFTNSLGDITNAIVNINNNSKGVILPQLTTTQRDAMSLTYSLTITNGGSGYLPLYGGYCSIPLTGGSGTGAIVCINIVGGVIDGVIMTSSGTGYLVGDILSLNNSYTGGAGSGVQFTVNQAPDGMLIYNTTTSKYNYWNGTAWTEIGVGGGTVNSVGAGTGMSFTTITTSGNVAIDTTKVPYYSGGFSTGLAKWNGSAWTFDTNTYLTSITSSDVTTALGYTPVTNARTLTINGSTQDLTANRSWTVGDLLSSGSYSNPTWLTSLAWSKISGTPTTLSGYGITDGVSTSRTLTINGTTQDLTADRSWSVGDVVGPSSVTNNAIVRFDTTTGKLIKNSGATIDDNNNITVNATFNGFTSVVASATPIVLTAASTPVYYISTGVGPQVIQLPVATTLPKGTIFSFNNNQSGSTISVNNNSGTLVKSVPSGAYLTLELTDNTTATGIWDSQFQTPSNAAWSTNTLDWAGSYTNGTWNGTTVAYNRGGTGSSSAFVQGGIMYGSSTSALASTAAGTSGQVLISNGTSAPTWGTVTGFTRVVSSVNSATVAGSAANTDYVYLVSGTTTVTLPAAAGNTNLYTIKRVGTNTVSIATTAGTIDGSASPITITRQYVSLTLVSDGTNWNII